VGIRWHEREEVTSLAANKNGEEKVAKKKISSKRGKQERGGEDPELKAQGVNGLDQWHKEAGDDLGVGLTLTEDSKQPPPPTSPKMG
jgi:hypothetical protein